MLGEICQEADAPRALSVGAHLRQGLFEAKE
jgi:hypothetical protein